MTLDVLLDRPASRIGVDFDNTLVDYSELLWSLAVERGLASESLPRCKRSVRDALRAGAGGEDAWRSIQVMAYGECIARAKPMPGAREFLALAASQGADIFVVSHKTMYPNFGPRRVNLREKALCFLEGAGLLEAGRIPGERVHFLSTRGTKVSRLSELALDHFVDDLPEIFEHKSYPRATRGVLFDPSGGCAVPAGITSCRSFDEVARCVLGTRLEGGE